ncbi:MAG: MSMEG_0570 family nitrogen starvation response protein [Bacteroidia bacterium]|jgi:uncharacterized repeat protein (TIGR04042 family)
MPEMHFQVRWPDGRESNCYSPSLVIREHLQVGSHYALHDFVQRVHTALHIASDRVRAKYGFACSMALDQLAAIEATAGAFAPDSRVQVLAFDPEE